MQVCNLEGVFLPGFLLCVYLKKKKTWCLVFHIQLTGDKTGFCQEIKKIGICLQANSLACHGFIYNMLAKT